MDKKVVVISGQNRTINLALAENLLKHDFNVAYCEDNKVKLVNEMKQNEKLKIFSIDFSDKEQLENAMESIVRKFGKIGSVIFTNEEKIQGPFLSITEEDWEKIYQTTLLEYFLQMQVFSSYFIETKTPGKMISISSTSSIIPRNGLSCYSTNLAAQNFLNYCLALELARYGITINSMFINSEEQFNNYDREKIRHNKNITPFISLSDLSNYVMFMLSESCNSMTGKEIIIDSGEILGTVY